MPKQLHSWSAIESISFLKLVFFGFLFSILFASCNNHKPGPVTDEPDIDTTGKINWLDLEDQPGWATVAFSSDASDSDNIKREKKIIRAYVRGSLAEYNAINKVNDPGAVQFYNWRVSGLCAVAIVAANW